MKILYHAPSLDSIYANRTIYTGYKNAFINMGHKFEPLTAEHNFVEKIENFQPDLFITSSHFWYRKYINYDAMKSFRKNGLFVLTKIDFWDSPISRARINEAKSLRSDKKAVSLIRQELLGDDYFHVVENDDVRMIGFQKEFGFGFHTIPLAADAFNASGRIRNKFIADISYIGTNLPDKRDFFKNYVYPMKAMAQLKIYGQDWTKVDKLKGFIQKIGQYYNIPALRTLQRPKLELSDEADIYKSSLISINVHEKYQRQFGGDCNERTFKIPYAGGFQIVDNVACIKKYFKEGEEIIVGENGSDWQEKVRYYLDNPNKRNEIIQAGKERVLKEHTYTHRAKQMLKIAKLL